MIDLILTAVIGGMFYAGFTGNKFKTLKEAAKAGLGHLGLK